MTIVRGSTRFFFGWWVVIAAFFIAAYTSGVFYGFTAFFTPLVNEFSWSYTQVSLAASMRGLELGLLAPLAGLFIDRWGPRRVVFIGATVSALGMLLFSRTTSLGVYYGAFVVMAVGMSGCVGFPVLFVAVSQWFRKNVGLAIGLVACGNGLGGALIPLVVKLIDLYEWRTAAIILAIGLLVIVLPLSLVLRHKPEQYGYLPDGQSKEFIDLDYNLTPSSTTHENVTVKQALRNRTFWHIGLSAMVMIMVTSSVFTHVMPYLSSIEISRNLSGWVATAVLVLGICGRIGFGWVGDKRSRKLVAATTFILIGLGMLAFAFTSKANTWLIILFIGLFGFGYGGAMALLAPLVMDFFGIARMGTILGFTSGLMALGSVAGAPLAGLAFDSWQSYREVWLIFGAIVTIAAIVLATIPRVRTAYQEVNQ